MKRQGPHSVGSFPPSARVLGLPDTVSTCPALAERAPKRHQIIKHRALCDHGEIARAPVVCDELTQIPWINRDDPLHLMRLVDKRSAVWAIDQEHVDPEGNRKLSAGSEGALGPPQAEPAQCEELPRIHVSEELDAVAR